MVSRPHKNSSTLNPLSTIREHSKKLPYDPPPLITQKMDLLLEMGLKGDNVLGDNNAQIKHVKVEARDEQMVGMSPIE